MSSYRFQRIGIAFPGHGIPESEQCTVGGEIDGPGGVGEEEISGEGGPGGGGVDLVEEVFGHGEAVAGEGDGGLEDGGPGEGAVVGVEVGETAEFAWDGAVEREGKGMM